MISEKNIHSRNVKFVSVLFIVYWLLELQPSSENLIRLQVINYEIHNPALLPLLANLALVYVGWRLWLSTRKTGKFRNQLLAVAREIYGGQELKLGRYLDTITQKFEAEAMAVSKAPPKVWLNAVRPRPTDEEATNILSSGWSISHIQHDNNNPFKVVGTIEWNLTYQEDKKLKKGLLVDLDLYRAFTMRSLCFVKTVVSREHFANYTLSWLLFFIAIICSTLIRMSITPTEIMQMF